MARLAARTGEWEPISGPQVAQAQLAAFRAWQRVDGERFGKLRRITQPCLVVNGVFDNMIPVRNPYALGEHLPRAILLTYPDAGHGSLFQFHESFVRQAWLFLDSEVLQLTLLHESRSPARPRSLPGFIAPPGEEPGLS